MSAFRTLAPVVCLACMVGLASANDPSEKASSHPRLAQEGESCNGSLPPRYAVICGEGLYCQTPGSLLGAWGYCAKVPKVPSSPSSSTVAKDEKEEGGLLEEAVVQPDHMPKPAVARKGEKCNGSLPPQFAVICAGDLVCEPISSPVGGWGRCMEAKDIESSSLSSSSSSVRDDEPEKVGGFLPFMFITIACISMVCGVILRHRYDLHLVGTSSSEEAVGEHYLLIA